MIFDCGNCGKVSEMEFMEKGDITTTYICKNCGCQNEVVEIDMFPKNVGYSFADGIRETKGMNKSE